MSFAKICCQKRLHQQTNSGKKAADGKKAQCEKRYVIPILLPPESRR